jgi:ADP-heptose:LPS heptosyltransferase
MPKELHLNRPGAIGDIIMTLIAIDKYKKLNPSDKIVYYCDPGWKDLPLICPAVDEVRSSTDFDIKTPGAQNLYGYASIPLIKHLTWYFGKELGLNDTFYNYGFKPVFKPSMYNLRLNRILEDPRKIITIHTNAGWSPYKNWDIINWQKVINRFNNDYQFSDEFTLVQIGQSDARLEGVIDMRNELTVTECIQLIKEASLHLGIDSFSNHATALLPYTPSVILWGSTHPGIFGYGHNVNIWKPLRCSPCNKIYNNLSKTPQTPCPADPHPCMAAITVDEVFNAILKQLEE